MIKCELIRKGSFLSLFKNNFHTGNIAGFGNTMEEAISNGMKNLKKKNPDNLDYIYNISDSARKIAEKHVGERFTHVDELYYCPYCDLVISKTEVEELCSNCVNKPIKECVKM